MSLSLSLVFPGIKKVAAYIIPENSEKNKSKTGKTGKKTGKKGKRRDAGRIDGGTRVTCARRTAGRGSLAPEGRQEEHENGEEFQTADQHFERREEFRRRGEPVEIACRADLRCTGTDVAQARHGDRQCGFPRAGRAEDRDEQGEEQRGGDVGGEERDGLLNGRRLHADVVQVDARDELREDAVLDLGEALAPDQERAHAFQTAGGRSAASADQGESEQQGDRDGRPHAVIADRESGGGHEGSGLERRVADGASGGGETFRETVSRRQVVHLALEQQGDGDDGGHAAQDDGVHAELLVAEIRERPAGEEPDVQGEIRAGYEHEEHDDERDRGAVERGDAVLTRAEPAGGDGREGVADRLEEVHPGEPEQEDLQGRDAHVDEPQDLRGGRDARRDLRVGGFQAGRLGVVHHLAAAVEHRQDGQHQHHDSHAAEPRLRGAPEDHAFRQALHAQRQFGAVPQGHPGMDERGSGGGEPGERFEERVVPVHADHEEERQRPDDGGHDPAESGHGVAFAETRATVLFGLQAEYGAADDPGGQRAGRAEEQGAHVFDRIVAEQPHAAGEDFRDPDGRGDDENEKQDEPVIHGRSGSIIWTGRACRASAWCRALRRPPRCRPPAARCRRRARRSRCRGRRARGSGWRGAWRRRGSCRRAARSARCGIRRWRP